jgi:hypothetical protein
MAPNVQPFDPYRSPSLPEGPYAGKPPSGRPGLLTALCAVAIVLGVLGLLNAVLGAGGAIAGEKLQALFQPGAGPGTTPEMQQVHQDFQDEVNAIQRRHFVPLIGIVFFRFVAALLLLLGGLWALGLQERGRILLIAALGVASAFELSNAILQTMINMETMTAVNSFVDSLVQTMPQGQNAPPGMQNFTQTVVRGSIILGFVVFYGLVLAKLVVYLGGIVYLQKQHIRGLFKTES